MNQRRLAVLENKATAAGIPRSGTELRRLCEGLDDEAFGHWLPSLSNIELANLDAALSAEARAQGMPEIDFSSFTCEELDLILQGDLTPLTERGIAFL